MDCDMISLIDFAEVQKEIERQPDKAILCCQHNYIPKTEMKATGVQTTYPRKNWSSFMIFNNEKCKALTPEYVNTVTGMELHRFMWIDDSLYELENQQYREGKLAGIPAHESLIGMLPLGYNWLVGEYEKQEDVKILHYTLGTPCFPDYRHCDYADLWLEELKKTLLPMGFS